MRQGFRSIVGLIILQFFSACGENHQQHSKQPAPPKHIESGAWFISNHADKIADSDSDRNIIQIKVLDQTSLGSRQCGYQSLRNFYYLAALSEAIEKRDSLLVNTLYQELNNVDYYRAFVDELARIRGCPTTHFHESNPSEEELRNLFSAIRSSFPSTLSVENIIAYGIVKDDGNELRSYKVFPSIPPKNYYDSFLREVKEDFGVDLPISTKLQELINNNLPSQKNVQMYAIKSLENFRPFPIYIYLEGSPDHAVSASVFMAKLDQAPTFLFADSWHDLSFKSGWSKATVDLMHKMIANFDDGKNLFLIRVAWMHFSRRSLLWKRPSSEIQALSDRLALAAKDQSKKSEILTTLVKNKVKFDEAVREFNLTKASLYEAIRKLVQQISAKYENALRGPE